MFKRSTHLHPPNPRAPRRALSPSKAAVSDRLCCAQVWGGCSKWVVARPQEARTPKRTSFGTLRWTGDRERSDKPFSAADQLFQRGCSNGLSSKAAARLRVAASASRYDTRRHPAPSRSARNVRSGARSAHVTSRSPRQRACGGACTRDRSTNPPPWRGRRSIDGGANLTRPAYPARIS